MAANTSPIFTLTPNVGGIVADGDGGTAGPLKTANTNRDGTGTVTTIFTAGANGSYIKKIRLRAVGTNVATVARVFLNNGSSNATIANNRFLHEISLPVTTASATLALQPIDIELNIVIPASWRVYVTVGTSVSAGWFGTCEGADY